MKPLNNIAAQNERVALEICERTLRFRNRDAQFPEAVYTFLREKGVDPFRCVLLSASTAEQGVNPIAGHLLTAEGRFFDFDLDCDEAGKTVIEIHAWQDVTAEVNINEGNPGFGKAWGKIAIDVQQRLLDEERRQGLRHGRNG